MEKPLQILHTPWRRAYVAKAMKTAGCIFCDLLATNKTDAERYILKRGERAFLILNIYPYTPGHLMAVPYRHVAHLGDLEAEELPELFRLSQLAERLLRRAYGCRSVHTGANLGRAAGAGVPDHLHFHSVAWPEDPLWETCCVAGRPPESIDETYRRFCEILATM